jgi:hypothetical protein
VTGPSSSSTIAAAFEDPEVKGTSDKEALEVVASQADRLDEE